jgi:hypothetical protein
MPKKNPKVTSNAELPGLRRFAAPDSIYFRTWFAQKQRKERKADRWLLSEGYWEDSGLWIDRAAWNDGEDL